MKSIIVLSLFLIGVSNGKIVKNEIYKDKEVNDKIVYDFSNKSNSLDSQEQISDKATIMVRFDYDFQNRPKLKDYDDVDEFRKDLLTYGKAFHKSKNSKLMQDIDSSKLDDLYVSTYTPYFTFTMEKDELSNEPNDMLYTLATNDNISQILVTDCLKKDIPNMTSALNYVGVYPTISLKELTGSGVTVGILEPGILDKNHANFANTDVTVRNELLYFETVEEHTTIMGSIIAGSNGIAPNAKLLSVELNGAPTGEIDWLLDRGVNIINLSYGDTTPTGVYSDKSAYMDYISYTYLVTIVASAGNSDVTTTERYVANPGLGYNVITLGACSDNNPYRRDFSAYDTVSGPSKPNFLAPGYNVTVSPFGLTEGTSVSSAFTSGCIALLMEKYPQLKANPAEVRAVLSATADVVSSTYQSFNGLDDHVGTGVLNFADALAAMPSAIHYENTQDKLGNHIVTLYTDAQAGQNIRVCLSWLAEATGTASETTYTDYDILIKDSSGNILLQTNRNYENIEFLEFPVTTTGRYGVSFTQRTSIVGTGDNIGFAYKVYTPTA